MCLLLTVAQKHHEDENCCITLANKLTLYMTFNCQGDHISMVIGTDTPPCQMFMFLWLPELLQSVFWRGRPGDDQRLDACGQETT